MTAQQSPDEAQHLAMYLAASPFYVDLESPEEKDTIRDRIDSLPQNIQSVLISEETAGIIWNLAVVKHGLSEEDVKEIARIIRDIVMGHTPANTLRPSLQSRLQTTSSIVDDIVKRLTEKIISPNYFQIAQLYERKQRGGSAGSQRPSSSGTTLPPNVVDLRNSRPSPRTPLPPSPPQVPGPNDEPPDNFPTPA